MNRTFSRRALLLTLAILAMATKQAQAQERYFSIGFGTSQTARSDMTLKGFPAGTDVRFGGVQWRNEPWSGNPYYVIKVGTYFKRQARFGMEFEFNHNKAIVRTDQNVRVSGTWKGEAVDTREPMRNKAETVRFTNGVNIISLMALYRFADSGDRWQPYVGLGPSYYVIWSRTTIDGRERYMRYRESGWGYQAQAGIRYNLNRRSSVYAEFKYTQGPGRAVTADNGEIYSPLRSYHETFGYSYRF